MRKVLAVVTVAAILCIGVSGAFAQVRNMQVYFDENLTQTQGECQGMFVLQELPVVCNNFNMYLQALEFGIVPPTLNASYAGDVHLPDTAVLGGPSISGILLGWPLPKNAFNAFVCMRIRVQWLCESCEASPYKNEPVKVVPSPFSGVLEATEWPSYTIYPVVGMTSLICPLGVSTEESTWGRVKSLYTE